MDDYFIYNWICNNNDPDIELVKCVFDELNILGDSYYPNRIPKDEFEEIIEPLSLTEEEKENLYEMLYDENFF